jgi:hypothetical protein
MPFDSGLETNSFESFHTIPALLRQESHNEMKMIAHRKALGLSLAAIYVLNVLRQQQL